MYSFCCSWCCGLIVQRCLPCHLGIIRNFFQRVLSEVMNTDRFEMKFQAREIRTHLTRAIDVGLNKKAGHESGLELLQFYHFFRGHKIAGSQLVDVYSGAGYGPGIIAAIPMNVIIAG